MQRLLAEVLPEAALFEATERSGRVGLVVAVDEHGARLQSVAYGHRLVQVPREDAGSQSELGLVRALDHRIDVTLEKTLATYKQGGKVRKRCNEVAWTRGAG